jgi:hypothetical protein
MTHVHHANGCEPAECPTCDEPQLARNTLFDGKPMSARDFLDEQTYFLGKHRRHNRYLHGWGTVCGLPVEQHPNPACRSQYVVVQPGLAIDCCGREILVRSPAMADLRALAIAAWHAREGADAPPDTLAHRLSLTLEYVECPAEPVPAVFDGCGQGDSACLPGKLVDGYRFGVALDRPVADPDHGLPRLEWEATAHVAGAVAAVAHSASERVFVLSGQSPALLVVLDRGNGAIVGSTSFAGKQGRGLAVSADGTRLFVALGATAAGDSEIAVLDATNLAAAPIRTLALAGSGAFVRLRLLRDGRLAALTGADKKLTLFTDAGGSAAPPAPASVTLTANPAAFAEGARNGWLYVGHSDSADIAAVDLATLAVVSLPMPGGTARTGAIGVIERDNRDLLLVASSVGGAFLFLKATPEAAASADRIAEAAPPLMGIAEAPRDLVVSPGGSLVWLLGVAGDGSAAVRMIAVDRHIAGRSPVLSSAIPAPAAAQTLALDGAKRLLIAFAGDTALPGGVAYYDIAGDRCLDLFDKVLDPCSSCDDGDVLVLATIDGWHFGDPFTTANIDNRAERRLLASTQLLSEIITCIAERECSGGGGTGPMGPQGPKGDPGDPGANGVDGNNGVNGLNGIDGTNGLNGINGKDGVGLRDDLPRIVGINWPHGGRLQTSSPEYKKLMSEGFVVAFDQRWPVLRETFNEHSVRLLRKGQEQFNDNERVILPVSCWCEAQIEPAGVKIDAKCGEAFDIPPDDDLNAEVTGLRFRPLGRENRPVPLPPGTYRIIIEGDHILGAKEIEIDDPDNPGSKIKVLPALDANHFAFGLPKRCPTGDRVEGGRFLSWFTIDGRD